ncbi:hypothetical protein [Antribacter gilvus]|uniref:hypothetical protein n=1 Tax=Antribacter gilvus TaxID=2304675 RepID=UPI000F796A3F|nr:hypothetical protein [Antribacter gilvus]
MIPADLVLFFLAVVLVSAAVGLAVGLIHGRDWSVSRMDPDHLAAALYRADCPGGHWLLLSEVARTKYREFAQTLITDLSGGL